MQVPLDAEGARKVFKLIDALEDSDDVQNVYSNFDVSDESWPRRSTRDGAPVTRSGPHGRPAGNCRWVGPRLLNR